MITDNIVGYNYCYTNYPTQNIPYYLRHQDYISVENYNINNTINIYCGSCWVPSYEIDKARVLNVVV